MDNNNLEKKEIVGLLLKRGVLVTPEILEGMKDDGILRGMRERMSSQEFDAGIVLELQKMPQAYAPRNSIQEPKQHDAQENGIKVLSEKTAQKEHIKTVGSFVDFFNNRHKKIEKILRSRPELSAVSSINKIASTGRKEASVIAIVSDIQTSKNHHLILTLEDSTGYVKAIVHKDRQNLLEEAKEVVLDEIIGVSGTFTGSALFVNKIIWPDIPAGNTLKKSEEEFNVAFISDLHVGSNNFLPEDFERFLKWTKGEIGNTIQRETIKKLKYIIITGDLVDGCGIYPGQEEELAIGDIYKQYEECARLLAEIPKNIQLIICPGNHDAIRLAEPQPSFHKIFSKPLMGLANAVLVSNPSLVNIGSTQTFDGFDVLMYHGASFDHFVKEVSALRNKGGYDRGDLIMKFLLKRRHLAPAHGSTSYVPGETDVLVVDTVPDFFVSGHIHKSIVANYRKVTLISGSCWQSKTKFQEKVGHNPEPSRVPVVNMKTREVKILKFG